MNKSELDFILKKARTPEPPKEFWEEFPQLVVRGLSQSPANSYRTERNWFPQLAWGFATTICILAAFVVGHWRGRLETKTTMDVLADSKVVQQTLAMFPNQVRAIVQDEHGLNLVLAENNNVPTSTPIYIRVCDGKQCASVVTFSGQEIQIAGQKMTVLSDAQGGIILMGSDFAWSSREPPYVKSDLKIEARNLSSVAM